MSKIARRFRITGRVQGVGFRMGLCAIAETNGIAGWVRNRRDGSVEAELEGSEGAMQAVLDWARRGPPGARVDAVDVEALDALDAVGAAPGRVLQRPTL